MTWTENVQHRFPGYVLDKEITRLTNLSVPTIELDELLDFFRSKDLSRYEKEKGKFFTGDSRFLSGKAQE